MRLSRVMGGMVVGVAIAGAAVAAQPAAKQWRGRGHGPMDGMASYLGLTEDQKAQLADQREKGRPQMQALFAKMRDNRDKMQQALAAAAPDPAVVGALAIEGHNLQLQMKDLRDAGDKALRALLTPEQQTKLDALQALRKSGAGRMGPMGQMGRMPFGPPPSGDVEAPGPDGGPPQR
jgi:Spy/CpxP family protein refolding chaperone